jgi:hypothetical protein
VVGGTAVCAFTVEAFVSVYECFVAVTLGFVLCYAGMAVEGIPCCGVVGGTAFTVRL